MELISSPDDDMGQAGAALRAQCGPHPARAHRQILKRPEAALQAAVIPALGRPAGDAELAQRPLGRQVQRFAVVGDEDRPRVSSDKRVRPSHKSCAECPFTQLTMLRSVSRSGHDLRACFAVRQESPRAPFARHFPLISGRKRTRQRGAVSGAIPLG